MKYTKDMFKSDLAFIIGMTDAHIFQQKNKFFKPKPIINEQRFQQFKEYCRKNMGIY